MTRDIYLHNMKNFAQIIPVLKNKLIGDFDGFCVDKLDNIYEILDWSFNEIFEKEK